MLKDALNKPDNISKFTGATLVRGFGSTDAGAGAKPWNYDAFSKLTNQA